MRRSPHASTMAFWMRRTSMRHIILISGPPASGKSAIATPIAHALHFALLTKDGIKESIFSSLGAPAGDLEFSRRLSTAAIDLLWALAPHCPQVVLEANFPTQDPAERRRAAALLLEPDLRALEIHCRLPLDEAARRFAARARTGRHPAHALQEMTLEGLTKYAEPFALTPVIEVDTTSPVDLDALIANIRQILDLR